METERNNQGIKGWAPTDRPREKMLEKGRNALSDSELLAIIIGSGNRDKDAVELSREILAGVNNDLNKLAKMGIKDLTKHEGIGEAKAISIIAAVEIGNRRRAQAVQKDQRITNSSMIFDFIYPHLADLNHEEVRLLSLSRANAILSNDKISEGGLDAAIIDIRKIFSIALTANASSIVICHNHPSGNIVPSKSDTDITKRIADAGKIMNIPLLDHLIIGQNKYYSFADETGINNL